MTAPVFTWLQLHTTPHTVCMCVHTSMCCTATRYTRRLPSTHLQCSRQRGRCHRGQTDTVRVTHPSGWHVHSTGHIHWCGGHSVIRHHFYYPGCAERDWLRGKRGCTVVGRDADAHEHDPVHSERSGPVCRCACVASFLLVAGFMCTYMHICNFAKTCTNLLHCLRLLQR